MTTTGVATFDRTVQKTHEWLNELMSLMDWDDKDKAYLALRATLHTLRDRLTPAEAIELGAQLPMLIRGFYYEGWRPNDKPLKERHIEEFLSHIEEALDGYRLGRPEDIARGVFKVLRHHVSDGEVRDIRHILPKEIRALFN